MQPPTAAVRQDLGEATDTGCAHCRDRSLPWNCVHRLAAYQHPLRDWIVAMKFGHAWAWAPWFGKAMAGIINDTTFPTDSPAEASPDAPASPHVVIPVPLHWRRRVTRGFDQSFLIADALAAQHHWPLLRAIKRIRHTHQQSQLPRSKRIDNVRRAFALRRHLRHHADRPLAGQTVYLIDDVLTTGATAAQCARLLRSAGAIQIHLVVAAVTDPHD